MPSKKTKSGREYEVTGKKFHWFPLDDDDQPSTEAIVIPMRLKLKTVLDVSEMDMDAKGMRSLLERLVPTSTDALDEMDLNDFQEMFTTWHSEYEALSGATLGESEGSSN